MDKDLIAALQAVQQQNTTGLVLDLRNDPGSLLDQTISVVSQFESSGTVLNELFLSDGSAIIIATQEWVIPNGQSF